MARTKPSSITARARTGLLAGGLVAACIAAAGPAHAQEPGVVYEPGSPSYKEYSIPLEEVRRDNGGGIPGRLESKPFGIGLSRGGQDGRRAPSGGDVRRGGGSQGGDAGGSDDRTGAASSSRNLRERLADAEAADAGFLWTLGPLLLVLLPALIVGLILARRGVEQQPVT